MNLETDRLIIQSITKADLPAVLSVYEASRDFFDLQMTEELSGQIVRSDFERAVKFKREFVGIYKLAEKQLIGACMFAPNNFQNERDYAWIDLLVIQAIDRRHGLGREAYQSIEQHIFSDPQVTRIGGVLLPQFDPSLKFAQAMGFEQAGGPFKNKRGYGLYSFVKRRPDLPESVGEKIWKQMKKNV